MDVPQSQRDGIEHRSDREIVMECHADRLLLCCECRSRRHGQIPVKAMAVGRKVIALREARDGGVRAYLVEVQAG